ncbi:hypothetical protein CK203_058050 [Vitis vinifera]|uniref:Uncharacterized protein n=1 Tax=Vitis vinifera TaxID=29760 RepID=A0A438GF09_VITVI|nr:hypothetical protein CK203_058050 [Vitis vinifera]
MGYVANGSTCHCLEVKLKALKKDLKVGNKEVFENVSFNKQSKIEESSLESMVRHRASGHTIGSAAPDRGARHVSSWEIRMELLRIAMWASCHSEGSLHLAHADGLLATCASHIPPGCLISGILLRQHSTRMYHIRNSSPPSFHPDISHPVPDAGWERRGVSTSPVRHIWIL